MFIDESRPWIYNKGVPTANHMARHDTHYIFATYIYYNESNYINMNTNTVLIYVKQIVL